jgi:hypothetical protein
VSRLDSFIRRLSAQRSVLDWAAGEIQHVPGPVLEIGLGNGRTFDHLREKLPDRAIYAFDRADNAHPQSKPAGDLLVLGEFATTLPAFAASHGAVAALVHCDTGSGDAAANARQAAWLSDLLPSLGRPGALVLSDQALSHARLRRLAPTVDIPPDRYFLYAVT